MMALRTLWVGVFAIVASSSFGQAISIQSLLAEMTDLGRLARPPFPRYGTAQASSYDRASKDPKTDWFANADYGKYLRVELRGSRVEHVLADLVGPGAVVRIWSANPVGVARFYFDGELEARFSAPVQDLLGGKVPGIGDPFAYTSARGWNCYFPFPYAKRLKITVDESQGERVRNMYYHVNYRTYSSGTRVRTFNSDQLSAAQQQASIVRKELLEPDKRLSRPPGTVDLPFEGEASPGAQIIQNVSSPGTITEIRLRLSVVGAPKDPSDLPWDSPFHLHNALRTTRLTAEFDGKCTVDVPLGDFFGSAPGLNPFKSLPFEMRSDGWMICRLPMPFGREAELRITNEGRERIRLEGVLSLDARKPASPFYYLHAHWIGDRVFTRPMWDMPFLNAFGEGRLIGSNLHIANPVGTWWGEGDEKIYVDGESFPSTFGTGTEDYYGYAWGSPELFERPYHAQPRCDGPATFGHSSINRWHVLDDIPFTKSLRFDMELWHWAEVTVSFDRTVYWYATGPSVGAVPLSPRGRLPVEAERPKPVKGAIEGESLVEAGRSGGTVEIQDFFELSNGKQLWWRDAKKGDVLALKVVVREPGTYAVSGSFCMNNDYGIHSFRMSGQALGGPVDFYSSSLKWEVKPLGEVKLQAGEAVLEIVCEGHRQGAIPRHMLGIDYLLLTKK